MSEQLTLDFQDDASDLMAIIRAIVSDVGLKEVAFSLGMTDSALSNALAERKRRVIPIQKLPRLVKLRGGERIARYVARLLGQELVPYVPPSKDEEYVALVQVIGTLPDMIRKPLLKAKTEQLAINRGAVLRVIQGGAG